MARSTIRIRDANLEVRPDLGCLKNISGEEIYLRPKTFQMLLLLLEQRHRVVTKEEIATQIWRDTAVTDDALVQCIVEIRKTLGDDAKQARYVRTIPKSGYRFVGEVDVVETDNAVPDPPRPAVATATERTTPETVSAKVETGTSRIGSWISIARPAFLMIAMLAVTIAIGVYVKATNDITADSVVASLATSEPQRPRVAVMFLENQSHTPELDWLREGLPDMLVTGLSRSKGLSVVGRQQLDLLLDRSGHERGTRIELLEAIDVAKRAHLDDIIVGSFAKLGNTIRVDLRVHDGAGNLVHTEGLTIDTPDDLLKQVDLLSWRLAQHFGEAAPVAPAPAVMLTKNLEAYRYYSLGVSQANHYHSAEAVELLTKATELDPEFAMAYGRIGYAYGVTGSQVDRARPYLAKAYRLSHRLSELDRLQVEAWNALVHLDYQSAATTLAQLIRNYPLEVEPYVRLGTLLAGERKYEEAIQTFRRGLAVDPESTDLWNRLGSVYGEAGKTSEGIAAHEKYVALTPNEANAYDSLGGSLAWVGRYDEAIAAFKKSLQLNPKFDVAWVHLGNMYQRTGQYTLAESAFRKYLDAAPSEIETRRGYASLAFLAQRRGRLTEAGSLIAKARPVQPFGIDVPIRIESGEPLDRVAAALAQPVDSPNRGSRPGYRALRYALGVLAMKQGATAEALDHFQAALRERSLGALADDLEDCLANAYLRLGRFDDAIAEYTRILRLNPRYPLAHYRLAVALEGKQQLDLARKTYEEFLKVWASADADVAEVVRAKAKLAR